MLGGYIPMVVPQPFPFIQAPRSAAGSSTKYSSNWARPKKSFANCVKSRTAGRFVLGITSSEFFQLRVTPH
jgi:hypothetical protein